MTPKFSQPQLSLNKECDHLNHETMVLGMHCLGPASIAQLDL